jgi:hypothetical protein
MKALAAASAELSLTRPTLRLRFQPPKAILLCLDQTRRRRVIGHNSAARVLGFSMFIEEFDYPDL